MGGAVGWSRGRRVNVDIGKGALPLNNEISIKSRYVLGVLQLLGAGNLLWSNIAFVHVLQHPNDLCRIDKSASITGWKNGKQIVRFIALTSF